MDNDNSQQCCDERIAFNRLNGSRVGIHYYPELALILDGKLSFQLGDDCVHEAVKGDMVLLDSAVFHKTVTIGGEVKIMRILLKDVDCVTSEKYCQLVNPVVSEIMPHEEVVKLRKVLINAARCQIRKNEFSSLACQGLCLWAVYIILTSAERRSLAREDLVLNEKKKQRIFRLMEFVEKNFMHKVNLSDFAEEEQCSMNYLSHFIKTNLKMSFQDFVGEYRFNHACHQIMYSKNDRLIDISASCGYSDYRYFSNAFKKRFGTTPEEYRKEREKGLYDSEPRSGISDEEVLRLLDALDTPSTL